MTHRHNACMQSYVPIAHSVLENCCFRVRDRVNLARSLCFSRLLFNVHVWSSLSPWAVRRLNGGYMRVLRRIAGQPKYKAGQWTDEKVRVCLSMPEIMCYISQNRLCYLAQLAEGRADTLSSLLNVSCHLPWVILVKQDLVQLWTDRHRPLATRSTVQRSGRTTLHGSLTSGSDRCAAGFARHQSWMKARRREAASERLKTSACSSVGPVAYVLKATEPSGAVSRWLTRREHL